MIKRIIGTVLGVFTSASGCLGLLAFIAFVRLTLDVTGIQPFTELTQLFSYISISAYLLYKAIEHLTARLFAMLVFEIHGGGESAKLLKESFAKLNTKIREKTEEFNESNEEVSESTTDDERQ